MGTWHLVSISECAVASLLCPRPHGKPRLLCPKSGTEALVWHLPTQGVHFFKKEQHFSSFSFIYCLKAIANSKPQTVSSQSPQVNPASLQQRALGHCLWLPVSTGALPVATGHLPCGMCQPMGYGWAHLRAARGLQPGCRSSSLMAWSRMSFPSTPTLMWCCKGSQWLSTTTSTNNKRYAHKGTMGDNGFILGMQGEATSPARVLPSPSMEPFPTCLPSCTLQCS